MINVIDLKYYRLFDNILFKYEFIYNSYKVKHCNTKDILKVQLKNN